MNIAQSQDRCYYNRTLLILLSGLIKFETYQCHGACLVLREERGCCSAVCWKYSLMLYFKSKISLCNITFQGQTWNQNRVANKQRQANIKHGNGLLLLKFELSWLMVMLLKMLCVFPSFWKMYIYVRESTKHLSKTSFPKTKNTSCNHWAALVQG